MKNARKYKRPRPQARSKLLLVDTKEPRRYFSSYFDSPLAAIELKQTKHEIV